MTDAAEKFYTLLKLERSRRRWRIIAFILIIFTGFMALGQQAKMSHGPVRHKDHIAEVRLEGMIFGGDFAVEQMYDLAADDAVKAVLIRVDSPGGTMVGGLKFYKAIRHVAETKPVAVAMETVAASAGYLASLGANHIIANEATLTGSVGVMFPLFDATELANKVGIQSDDVVSGELKAVTSPLWPRTPQDRVYLQGMVNELNNVFYKHVQERRPHLTPQVVSLIRDGRAVVGTQALEMGLIDAIGTQKEAQAWLIEKGGLANDISVVDYSLSRPRSLVQRALEGALPEWMAVWAKQGAFDRPAVWAVMR